MRPILVLSVVLLFAACGGGSKKSGSTPTAALASTSTVVTAPTPAPSGCTQTEAQQAIDAYKNAQQPLDEFDNARVQATEAIPDQLPAIITDLQRISRNAGAIKLPACAQPSRDHLVGSINGVIQALTDTQAGKPQADVQASADEARSRYDLFTTDLASLLHDATRK